MLDDSILVDRHLLSAEALEIAVRVVAELQGRHVHEVGHIGRHGRTDAAFKHDVHRLAGAVELQRREAELAEPVLVVDALDGDRGGVVGLIVLRRSADQVRAFLAARAVDHGVLVERTNRGR